MNDAIPSVPSDHLRLSPGTPRRKGDLFWSTTLGKWLPTTIGEGTIPFHGSWCRKIQTTTLALPPPAKPMSTAPRATNAKATPSRDWTRNSTPLMYVISDPFSGEDQLLVYQLDELQAALSYLQRADHDWAILYVFYQDHATQEYDRHMLAWREKNEVKDPLGLLVPGARS